MGGGRKKGGEEERRRVEEEGLQEVGRWRSEKEERR